MGNIDSLRDWGHAKDYVELQWLILQQEKPEDFVIATGEQYSVRQFILWAAEDVGMQLRFEGKGIEEVAVVVSAKGSWPRQSVLVMLSFVLTLGISVLQKLILC